MTQPNIPDQVSHDDLKKLLVGEIEQFEAQKGKSMFDDYSTRELITLCEEAKDALAAKCKHPMAHKVLAMLILDHFLNFHKAMGIDQFGEGSANCLTWARDVGKLEAARRLIADVSFGSDDWFVGMDFEPSDADICPDCSDDS